MKLLKRSQRREALPYVLYPPYREGREELLSRRPAGKGDGSADAAAVAAGVAAADTQAVAAGVAAGVAAADAGRLFAVVLDVGLDTYLVSVYLFADGTITIYSSVGIHSTGLRGAPTVVAAAGAILDQVAATLGEFSPVEDMGALPLPDRGTSQILVRTYDGDFAASDRFNTKHATVAELAAMALLLAQLARMALAEGFDRLEVGDVLYELDPEYRRVRSTLMDWLPAPEHVPASARVLGVAVEVADSETRTVTSLFAFADGSTSAYRSDGTLTKGLSAVPGVAGAARALLDSIDAALPSFRPAELISLPQPGRVQFVAHARVGEEGESTELVTLATMKELDAGSHPLSAAFARANEVLRLAHG